MNSDQAFRAMLNAVKHRKKKQKEFEAELRRTGDLVYVETDPAANLASLFQCLAGMASQYSTRVSKQVLGVLVAYTAYAAAIAAKILVDTDPDVYPDEDNVFDAINLKTIPSWEESPSFARYLIETHAKLERVQQHSAELFVPTTQPVRGEAHKTLFQLVVASYTVLLHRDTENLIDPHALFCTCDHSQDHDD